MKSTCSIKEFPKLLKFKYHKKNPTPERNSECHESNITERPGECQILLPISLKLVNTEIMRDALDVYIRLSYLGTLL